MIYITKLINMTGQKIGRWLVLNRAPNKNGRVYWWCKCECGQERVVSGADLRNGKSLSCGCLAKDINHKRIKDLSGQRFGYLIALKPTDKRQDHKAIWKCQCDCGNIVYVVGKDLTTGNTHSCGCAKKSIGEKKIEDILNDLNIAFIMEKTFSGCKDKRLLRFDFYLPDYNCCIEYDGIQHFKSNKGWNTDNHVKKVQKHDNIKTQYCKNNNIKLIRIPYTDFNKLNCNYFLTLLKEKDNE